MRKKLLENSIDIDLTNIILDNYNNKKIGQDSGIKLKEFPIIDNKTVIDLKNFTEMSFTQEQIDNFFNKYNLNKELYSRCKASNFILNRELLEEIGVNLYPFFSFGVLNGGSATSYVDYKKNRDFSPQLLNSLSDIFENLTALYKNRAKGITPAFINPNGVAGPSFMELKMRSLLLEAKRYKKLTGKGNKQLFPIFQMTSTSNNDSIISYYQSIKSSKYLKKLTGDTGINITDVLTGVQPLILAYTHSKHGAKKQIFLDEKGNPLPLPGGHGHCFYTLKQTFHELYNRGIKFVSIGNVDNIGYTVDPLSLALLGITNKEATFDFSFKTTFDVKGGVLIRESSNKINCADLGVAISKDEVVAAESMDKPILFNCATGLFNLEHLIKNLDYIIDKLPTRFTDQNKDVGLYSQAEQVTWEVISILDDFLILAVDKYDRFLASKLLLENLATSGLVQNIDDETLKQCAVELNRGLVNNLKNKFNLYLKDGEWIPND
ncbi:hypothetical protein EW093_15930 [Thiospirochaeta perfilievii]|uniref:Uncharacterized protein n=1 Tax=Thiospirochaeta perfilievii TaxID=252967 RepID=A0A5C1QEW8_9SPIO|nr:UTP--glucose-1-phosphate uridylyltransferase [Thiospirochaeta perfilievii]QEN06111.1 hypothetical protein EW093_15930 [Thiospirochaeta perfilievii]